MHNSVYFTFQEKMLMALAITFGLGMILMYFWPVKK